MQNPTVGKWIILFLILLFPSLLYVFLSTGKHQIIRLPHFGPKEFIAEPGEKRVDTTYYSIPSFVFTDQNQTEVSSYALDKNTKVFSFICIDCENSPSKRILAELAQLQALTSLDAKTVLLCVFLLPPASRRLPSWCRSASTALTSRVQPIKRPMRRWR